MQLAHDSIDCAASGSGLASLGPTLDRKGFECMVSPLLRGLRAKALRMTRNRADADDLVQETVLRAWRFWPRYVERDNCRAWLQRILINTFCTERRRAARLRAHLNEIANSAFPLAHETIPVVTAANEAARSGVAARLLRVQRNARAETELNDFNLRDGDAHGLDDRMNRALTRLNAEQRQVLWLVDVRERSYREVAAELACPIGTVMSRLHRARAALRLQLGTALAHA